MKNFIKFWNVASKTIKEPYRIYQFKCPLCEGIAEGGKSSINGHIHAHCTNCSIHLIQ